MARINIEDRIYREQAFQDLLIKTGNRHTAKGMVWELFQTAQEYWFPDRKPIPRERIDRLGLWPCIECGLAEERDGGVYVHGSENAFSWLFEVSAAGKRSAQARREKYGSAQPGKKQKRPKPVRTTFEQPSNEARTLPNATEPLISLLSSPSSSLPSPTPVPTPALVEENNTAAPSATPAATNTFIAAYCEEYRNRKGTHPVIDGAQAAAAKRAVKALGIKRATELIPTYLDWREPWFVKRGHDLQTFAGNLNRIVEKHDTGRVTTAIEARHAEQGDFYRNQLERIERGEL